MPKAAVTTTQRMLRNPKLALHLTDDARHLLLYGKATFNVSGCRIADIVKWALVEVFDVMETRISERLWSCGSLSEMKGIFIDERFILR